MFRVLNFLFWLCLLPDHGGCDNGMEPVTGPWGTLIGVPVVLEPGDTLVSKSVHLEKWPEGLHWQFYADSKEKVAEVLAAAGIPQMTIQKLVSEKYLQVDKSSGRFGIRPPEELFLSLTPEQRSSLYTKLYTVNGQRPLERFFNIAPGGIDTVLRVPHVLPPAQIDRVRKLTWQLGQTNWLADINYILAKAGNDEERFRVIKTVRRQKAVFLHLKIGSHSISELSDYWKAEGRNKEILPILESVSQTQGVDTLDVVHLLPPFPRKMIYTYPSQQGEGVGRAQPDCFWTSVSFFAESPPDRYFDSVIHQIVVERYVRVSAATAKFGDLILIYEKDTGAALHACNYIAGDYVFTKNGINSTRPWVFDTIDSVVKTYLDKDLTVSFFRLKPEFRN